MGKIRMKLKAVSYNSSKYSELCLEQPFLNGYYLHGFSDDYITDCNLDKCSLYDVPDTFNAGAHEVEVLMSYGVEHCVGYFYWDKRHREILRGYICRKTDKNAIKKAVENMVNNATFI